jgi:ABC-type branched-subunit amino acid transport system substrate-binding protein
MSVPEPRGHVRRARRLATVVVAVALAATACGSGRGSSSGDPSSGTSDTEQAAGAVTFGTLASPCGPAEGDAASQATEQGVTADSITIGYGNDAGYQATPGLNAEMASAVEGMIDWCNEQGGINGRTVEGVYYDAKVTEANNVMAEACGKVFMMVGQGFALDGAAEQTRVNCGLPSVAGFATNAAVATGPDLFQPEPAPPDQNSIGSARQVAAQFPEQVKKAAVVYGDFATTQETRDKAKASYPKAGWTFLDCDQSYPITGSIDWKPIVQRLKDCGVETVYFTGTPAPNFQNMLDAAAQLEFEPIYMTERNFYEESFALWNQNGNADRVYVNTQVVPFDLADDNGAVASYLDVVERAGGRPSTLGALSASAFLLWATAVDQCGADVTRDCVVANLEKVTEWDAGGLHSTANPGQNESTHCAMTLRMQGTTYQQWAPDTPGEFQCDDSYLVDITTPASEQAKLDGNRRSTVYTGG